MGRYRKPFTLFKRGKYWYYKTYDSEGYRTCGRTTGLTKKSLAEEYCLELLKLNQLGLSRLTFRDYSENFFDDDSPFVSDRETPLAHSTLRQHRQYLRLHIMPIFAESIAGHSLTGIEAVYTNFHAKDLESIRLWQNELYKEIFDNKDE